MTRLDPSNFQRGYILQEIVVGLVIFGIVIIPVLRAFRMLPQIGAAVNQQSRLEAWRSASDEAVLQGLDPIHSKVMGGSAELNPTNPMSAKVVRHDLPVRAGATQITVLSSVFSETAEERSIPAGFEIGAGTVPVPEREDPLPPLPPIKLAVPFLNPLSGTMVPILSLAAPAVLGAPYTLSLRAESSSSSTVVRLQTIAPNVHRSSGVGATSLDVDVFELAKAVRGQAWSEYAGNDAIDTPVALADGRTRWLVRDGSQVRAYEPSDRVDFVLGLDVGRPVYSVGGVTFASGETVPIDYERAVAVAEGRLEAVITYPTEVRERFGSFWGDFAPSFSWSFGPYPGDSTGGNTVSFFRREARASWIARQTLAAAPSGLPGMRHLTGTWTIERLATELEPPDRVAVFYNERTDIPGWLIFSAPMIEALKSRVGRPKINNVESVSDSVSIPLVP